MTKICAFVFLSAVASSAHAMAVPEGAYRGQVLDRNNPLVASAEIGIVEASGVAATRKLIGAVHLGPSTLPFTDGAYDQERQLFSAQVRGLNGAAVGVINCSQTTRAELLCAWSSLINNRQISFSLARTGAPMVGAPALEGLAGSYEGQGVSAELARHFDVLLALSAIYLPASNGGISIGPQLMGSIRLTSGTDEAADALPIVASHYDRRTGQLILMVAPRRSGTAVVELACQVVEGSKLSCDWRSLLSDIALKIELALTKGPQGESR